jgi:hypothetical protein
LVKNGLRKLKPICLICVRNWVGNSDTGAQLE